MGYGTEQTNFWCTEKDDYSYQDICDGSQEDCVLKGKQKCFTDPECYGIMYDEEWSVGNNGVAICKAKTLEKSPANWKTYLKQDKCKYCSEG